MTKKFSNLLLGLLWLMTITLATTFWMNIKYGFNIFSAAHWAYLSELQAYRTEIKLDFYISLIAAIIIGLTGLYLLARPRVQTFFIEPSQMPPPPVSYKENQPILNQPQYVDTEPVPKEEPVTQQQQPHTAMKRPMSPTGISRPNIVQKSPRTASVMTPKIPTPHTPAAPTHIAEIQSILEKGGYIIKPCERIEKLIKPVVALTYNQTVLVCSENVSTAEIQDALQTLITIFDDTLGDTADDMTVHGYIVNASDESTNPDLISVFDTLDEFQEFIDTHPNTKTEDFDQELFDAISTYIGTVTNYIGKQ